MRGPGRLYLCLAVAVYGAVSALWFLAPRSRGELYREGHTVELLTAWLFAAAAVATVVKVARAGLGWRHPYLLIAAVSAVSFGEEINWGTRELGITPPKVLWLEIQGLHDLITLGYAVTLEHGSWRSRGTIGLAALAAIVILAPRATGSSSRSPAPSSPRPPGASPPSAPPWSSSPSPSTRTPSPGATSKPWKNPPSSTPPSPS
jgi:hypothetical protein